MKVHYFVARKQYTGNINCSLLLLLVPDEIHGVLRQVWFNAIRSSKRLKDDALFKRRPNSEDVIESLRGTPGLADYYAQHLSTFLQVCRSSLFLCHSFLELLIFNCANFRLI